MRYQAVILSLSLSIVLMACGSSSSIAEKDSGAQPQWHNAQQIDLQSNSPSCHQGSTVNSLESVSCPTSQYCMAVDDGGFYFVYENGMWRSGLPIDAGNLNVAAGQGVITSVSCGSPGITRSRPNRFGVQILREGFRIREHRRGIGIRRRITFNIVSYHFLL